MILCVFRIWVQVPGLDLEEIFLLNLNSLRIMSCFLIEFKSKSLHLWWCQKCMVRILINLLWRKIIKNEKWAEVKNADPSPTYRCLLTFEFVFKNRMTFWNTQTKSAASFRAGLEWCHRCEKSEAAQEWPWWPGWNPRHGRVHPWTDFPDRSPAIKSPYL